MKSVFIVRPFGEKRDANGKKIDFEAVHRKLIGPAIAKAGLHGDTTAEITRSGNIRSDMFELLAKADLVIADVSIHNANVFYELGVRQSLRDKRTYLIRCQADEIPFDLKTDRYLVYDRKHPEKTLDDLVTGLTATLASTAVDSPIFQLVPELEPQDPNRLITIPRRFREAVLSAGDKHRLGDLELLSHEARGFNWAIGGLRHVGNAQFNLKAWESARETWEAVRSELPDDCEANFRLGTIYQRLGDLSASDTSIRRVVENPNLTPAERAEGFALLGSNEKTRWRNIWESADQALKPTLALESRYLRNAQQYYLTGFKSDLNHYYSGVNALALTIVMLELAAGSSEAWQHNFDRQREADCALDRLKQERNQLLGAVGLSVERRLTELKLLGKSDRWLDITRAGVKLLSVDSAERVAAVYRRALEGAEAVYFESERRQLALYRQLGIFPDHTEAALAILDELWEKSGLAPGDEDGECQLILFTGHRIDQPGREQARFPERMEASARQAIKEAISAEIEGKPGACFIGIAGGASGGDILFHEVCEELGIESKLFLAMERERYIAASVRVQGSPQWTERFKQLEKRCETRVLSPDGKLPGWQNKEDPGYLWIRNNLWTLFNALAFGGKNLTLIALWDGEKGDGPGGTEHMVSVASGRGAKIRILNSRKLLEQSAQQPLPGQADAAP